MSFLGTLGKFLGPAAGIAAAPFTGGASLIPTILGGAGAAVGAMGQGAAENRGAKTAAQLDRDVLAQRSASDYEQALENRAKLEMDRRTADAKARQDAFVQSLRSALALNFSPAARPEGVANISFVGKGIGEQGQAAAAEMSRQAMLRLLNGEKFDPLPAVERFTPSALPQASTWEKVAGILAPSLTAAGAIAKAANRDEGDQPTYGGGLSPSVWGRIRF
jgi:hypothetical protein